MSGSFGKRWALPKLVRFVTGFVFFNTAQGTTKVHFQHDTGNLVGRGRDPECYVAFIPYATSHPADFGKTGSHLAAPSQVVRWAVGVTQNIRKFWQATGITKIGPICYRVPFLQHGPWNIQGTSSK